MCNFQRTKFFEKSVDNNNGGYYNKYVNLVMMAQRKHSFPFRTGKLSSIAPMVLHGRLCGRVGRCQVLRIFSSVGQSNRLITGRSGVRVPEGPPFLGVQLSWESTCLARKGSRVRIPLPPPKLRFTSQLFIFI